MRLQNIGDIINAGSYCVSAFFFFLIVFKHTMNKLTDEVKNDEKSHKKK